MLKNSPEPVTGIFTTADNCAFDILCGGPSFGI